MCPSLAYSTENVITSYSIHYTKLYENLLKRYPDAQLIYGGEHSVLYPGFINTHVHLEFSANTTALQYGGFMSWLDSVIEKRNDLLEQCDNTLMKSKINEMLHSGTTAFGAISSFGAELEVCAQSPQRVVFFNRNNFV